MDTITFEEFKKIEVKMGKIISCEKVENADKLLRLKVDFGPAEQDSPVKQDSPEEKESSTEQDSPDMDDLTEKLGSEKREIRQIISGIAESFSPEELVGKTLPFVTNLEYRTFRGQESQGMLMATGGGSADSVVLLEPSGEVEPGASVV